MPSPLSDFTRERVRRGLRRGRLQQLVEVEGCDSACLLPDMFDGAHRWAAMQEHRAAGGPWWSTGADWRELLSRCAGEERAEEWPVTRLFDLDTGWQSMVLMKIVYEPVKTPEGGSNHVNSL